MFVLRDIKTYIERQNININIRERLKGGNQKQTKNSYFWLFIFLGDPNSKRKVHILFFTDHVFFSHIVSLNFITSYKFLF